MKKVFQYVTTGGWASELDFFRPILSSESTEYIFLNDWHSTLCLHTKVALGKSSSSWPGMCVCVCVFVLLCILKRLVELSSIWNEGEWLDTEASIPSQTATATPPVQFISLSLSLAFELKTGILSSLSFFYYCPSSMHTYPFTRFGTFSLTRRPCVFVLNSAEFWRERLVVVVVVVVVVVCGAYHRHLECDDVDSK